MRGRLVRLVIAALTTAALLVGTPVVAHSAPSTLEDTCVLEGFRDDEAIGSLDLWRCPGTPGHAGFTYFAEMRHVPNMGSYVALYYKPYYQYGMVPGSLRNGDGYGYAATPMLYGMFGELQACIKLANMPGNAPDLCTW